MKTKKVAKLLTFYFCNFKARRFKQGHKANLCLSAYNPSHTAVLSVLFAVMILSVFDNRTCKRCCSNSGNAHLARASSHFTTSPPQKTWTSFHLPLFPFSSWKRWLPSCWDQRESGFMQRKMTGTASRSNAPRQGRTLSRSFLYAWCLLQSFSRRNTGKFRWGTLRWGTRA